MTTQTKSKPKKRASKKAIALNPWQPTQDPIELAILGKFVEELNECSAIAARCIIQGLNECEPVTKVPNRSALIDEMGDVIATMIMAVNHYDLPLEEINARKSRKECHLEKWHKLIKKEPIK